MSKQPERPKIPTKGNVVTGVLTADETAEKFAAAVEANFDPKEIQAIEDHEETLRKDPKLAAAVARANNDPESGEG